MDYYKPNEKTLAEMCNVVPPHGISSNQWIKLVKYWHSDKGKNLSECGKEARASQTQFHRSGSNSYANQQADYEDDHGEKMSSLALWIKSHTGKDGTFLPGTLIEDFVDDATAKFEVLRAAYPSKSDQELEDEAFEHTMYGGEIPERPNGFGLGVRKSDIYGVHGVLRKQGYGKVQKRTVVKENVKEEVSILNKKNETLEKENGKLKEQVQENNFLLKTLITQFSQLVGVVRKGNASTQVLHCFQQVLGMAHQRVVQRHDKGVTGSEKEAGDT